MIIVVLLCRLVCGLFCFYSSKMIAKEISNNTCKNGAMPGCY